MRRIAVRLRFLVQLTAPEGIKTGNSLYDNFKPKHPKMGWNFLFFFLEHACSSIFWLMLRNVQHYNNLFISRVLHVLSVHLILGVHRVAAD